MTSQFDDRTKYSYLGMTFTVLAILMGPISNAAIRLDGKYFPPKSPIFADYYANDFLPWGMFLWLGWVCVDFVYKKYHTRSRINFISILVVFIGNFIFFYVRSILGDLYFQSNLSEVWASYLRELVEAWSFAWLVGGITAFTTNRFLLPRIKSTLTAQGLETT